MPNQFSQILLEKAIYLPPNLLGPKYKEKLHEKLIAQYEGQCSGRYGYIISITKIENIGIGKIQEGTGNAVFQVKFKAIVFRPFKGEILDAVVSNVSTVGYFSVTK